MPNNNTICVYYLELQGTLLVRTERVNDLEQQLEVMSCELQAALSTTKKGTLLMFLQLNLVQMRCFNFPTMNEGNIVAKPLDLSVFWSMYVSVY